MTYYRSTDDLIRACCRAIGYTTNMPAENSLVLMRMIDTLNEAIGRVWNRAQWPQLRLIESRTYRPPFSPIGFRKGQECYYNDKYYRATADVPMGIPGEKNADWEEVDLGKISKFIALDQPWELNKIGISGVNLDGFAYARDPRYFPDEEPIRGCAWAGDYPGGGTSRVLLPNDAPAMVYCAYLPAAPRVAEDVYQSGRTYSYGERVRYQNNSWRCVVSETDIAPGAYNERTPWAIERIPEFMIPAIKAYLKAEWQDDEQGRAVSFNRFEAELRTLVDTYFGQTAAFDTVAYETYDE